MRANDIIGRLKRLAALAGRLGKAGEVGHGAAPPQRIMPQWKKTQTQKSTFT